MPSTVESVALTTGVTLPYVEQGDPLGAPVILLHGPTDSWRSFEILLAQLRRRFAPSGSASAATGTPIARGAATGRRTSRATWWRLWMPWAWRRPCSPATGAGFTARRVALDHPGRVLGLVLIAAPHSLRGNPAFREFLQAVSVLTDPVDPDFVREFAGSTVTQPVSSAFFETAIAECCRVPARVWQATLSGLLEGDVPPTRESASVPALLTWGDRDEICPRSEQQALMAAIPGASLATYHGAGHSPHWEQPERSAADIAAFAERVGRTNPA